MKALVKAAREPGIWMQDVPEPAVGPNDVLIKVRRSAICGTDMHIYNWDAWAQKTIPVPMVVGHEYSGEIVEVGSEVRGVKVGDRVSGEGHIICGHCRNCRAGTAAPVPQHPGRRREPARSVRRIPDPPGRRTSSSSRLRSTTRSPRSSTRSAMPPTPRSPSIWWARTC